MFKPLLLLALAFSLYLPLYAGWFGESEEEKEAAIAERVADLMRPPRAKIAEAQLLADEGQIEDAIKLFREAQTELEKIERENDTRHTAFAALRLTKFHCISMLDDLVLRRSKVNDTRQAVTDTTDLELRLAKEREAARKAQEEAKKKTVLEAPTPPTLADMLPKMEAELAVAKRDLEAIGEQLKGARAALSLAQQDTLEMAQAYTYADGLRVVVENAVKNNLPITPDVEKMLPEVEGKKTPQAQLEAITQAVKMAKGDLDTAKKQVDTAQKALDATELRHTEQQQVVSKTQHEIDVVKAEIAREAAAARAKAEAEAKAKAAAEEAERNRLAAEAIARKQAEAARLAQEKKAAEAKAKADAKAKREAAEKQKKIDRAVAWCEELWNQKQIEQLETNLTKLLQLAPNDARGLVLLAKLRLLQQRPEDALELVALVPATDPRCVDAQMVGAGAYVSLKRPMDAITLLEQALQKAPTNPSAYMNMATVLLMTPAGRAQPDIAEQYYRKAIDLGAKRNYTLEKKLNIGE